jgi:hypothetical protein
VIDETRNSQERVYHYAHVNTAMVIFHARGVRVRPRSHAEGHTEATRIQVYYWRGFVPQNRGHNVDICT